MKRIILALTLLLPSFAFAAGGGMKLMDAGTDLSDYASLQNGAKLYVNYCAGCHSLEYMRYNRIGQDLHLTDEQVKENLMFSGGKIGDTMTIAMRADDAEKWFGKAPPDLSVIARSRGVDWLYTYLMTFYVDESRSTGMNNLVFKDVGMPHVLWELQGLKKAVHHDDGHGHETVELEYIDSADAAKEAEYRRTVRDLVNFLDYVGEPAKMQRYDLGWKVIAFLFFFLIVAFIMKKDFWRDVH